MDRFNYLFNRYASKTATELERTEFQNLLGGETHDQQLKKLIDEYFSGYSINPTAPELSGAEALLKAVLVSGRHNVQSRKLWPRIAVAAAAMVAIVFGVWFYTSRHPEFILLRSSDGSGSPLVNDIAPGTNKATLTLANGKIINLSDAKTGVVIDATSLKYNDNTLVLSNEEREPLNSTNKRSLPYGRDDGKTQTLTATTPRGGTYQITLSDGTRVWLNADSKLSFPAKFTGSNRIVALTGEGYFEVAKDKTRAFIVESRGQTVEVLGTHFNINSYQDEEDIKTTLLEGSVRVNLKKADKTAVLKPDQQAVFSGGQLKVVPVDAETSVAWKNGNFLFKGENIEAIMRRLASWYNIEVVYLGQKPTGQFRGVISRHNKISEVLKMMELTGAVHFKIEGRKVYVKE